MAYLDGKRESRWLLGDLVLWQQDIKEHRTEPWAMPETTWPGESLRLIW